MKLFNWIKEHPIESAAIAAAAAIGGPMAFEAMAPMLAGEGAAAAGGAAAGAAGAGTAGMVAGDAFLPGMLAGTEGLAGGSALLGGLGLGGDMGLGGAKLANPGIEPYLLGPMSGTSGGAGAFGLSGADMAAGSDWASGLPSAMTSNTNPAKPWLSGNQAMLLAQMVGSMGGQQQRPLGAPTIDAVPPMARQGMRTQEEITKAWLLKNDPATYARMYGMPQQMA